MCLLSLVLPASIFKFFGLALVPKQNVFCMKISITVSFFCIFVHTQNTFLKYLVQNTLSFYIFNQRGLKKLEKAPAPEHWLNSPL